MKKLKKSFKPLKYEGSKAKFWLYQLLHLALTVLLGNLIIFVIYAGIHFLSKIF